jgi:F-type H+-transporting ATPase subunit b
MEIISSIALITINETLIAQLVSFLIFLFIINTIMFRPLNRVMKKREEHVDRLKQDIEESEHEMARLAEDLARHEKDVRQAANAVKKEIAESGAREAASIFKEVKGEVLELKESTDKEIGTQIEKARKELRSEAEHLAVDIMENVLRRRLVR